MYVTAGLVEEARALRVLRGNRRPGKSWKLNVRTHLPVTVEEKMYSLNLDEGVQECLISFDMMDAWNRSRLTDS
jgi:hypothetical protein